MVDRHDRSDLLIIGGGPAGAACAIYCAQRGLSVTLLEHSQFQPERPGETMHPGVNSLLRQIGFGDQLDALATGFHRGIEVKWGDNPPHVHTYGSDESGPWLGFQLWRMKFDAELLNFAGQCGAKVLQPCLLKDISVEDDAITEAYSLDYRFTPRFVVDATGPSRFLKRRLNLLEQYFSPMLTVRYGYVNGTCPTRDQMPRLCGDKNGWIWTAKIRDNLYQWTRLNFNNEYSAHETPEEFSFMQQSRKPKGANVSWRMTERLSGKNWYIIGDAAASLDPTSSHGVLKALMSGLYVGNLICEENRKNISSIDAKRIYQNWLNEWMLRDIKKLRLFYNQLFI